MEGLRTADGTRFKQGSIVIYHCDEDFELRTASGAGQRTVQRVCVNGHWLGEDAVCGKGAA